MHPSAHGLGKIMSQRTYAAPSKLNNLSASSQGRIGRQLPTFSNCCRRSWTTLHIPVGNHDRLGLVGTSYDLDYAIDQAPDLLNIATDWFELGSAQRR